MFDVTVIIPVYNAEKYVRTAVDSALQFAEVKEVLLIEDGSPDNALEVCRELERQDTRVKLRQHPDKGNHGAGASRNLGLANASCPFIAFLDADDFFLPNRFDADKRIFAENPDADGVYNALGVYYYSPEAENIYKSTTLPSMTTVTEKIDPITLFESFIAFNQGYGYFSLDGLTVKRDVLEKMDHWFNPALRLHQDSEFRIRLAYTAKLLPGEIQVPTVNRGVHGENRIVNVQFDQKKKNMNIILLWTSLYEWAAKEKIPNKYLKHLYKLKVVASLQQYNYFYRWIFFIIYTARKSSLFFDSTYYIRVYYLLFGDNKLSHYFYDLLVDAKNQIKRAL